MRNLKFRNNNWTQNDRDFYLFKWPSNARHCPIFRISKEKSIKLFAVLTIFLLVCSKYRKTIKYISILINTSTTIILLKKFTHFSLPVSKLKIVYGFKQEFILFENIEYIVKRHLENKHKFRFIFSHAHLFLYCYYLLLLKLFLHRSNSSMLFRLCSDKS